LGFVGSKLRQSMLLTSHLRTDVDTALISDDSDESNDNNDDNNNNVDVDGDGATDSAAFSLTIHSGSVREDDLIEDVDDSPPLVLLFLK
jgi:hypothetical protein